MPRSSKSRRPAGEAAAGPIAGVTSNPKQRRKRRKATAAPSAPAAPTAPTAQPKAAHRSHFTTYQPSSNSWIPYIPSHNPSQQQKKKITLLTLNTWSSSPSHSPFQTQALHALIRGSGADVIALQEVSANFWNSLLRLEWVRREYLVAGGGTQGWWNVTESRGAGARGGQGKEGSREAVTVLVRRKWVGAGSQVGIGWMDRAKGEGGKGWIEVRLKGVGGKENAVLRNEQYHTVLSSLFTCPSSTAALAPLRILLADLNLTSPSESHGLTSPPYNLIDACPSATNPEHEDVEAEEQSFRNPPTFGHLYPWVPGAPKGKMRKPRRVDRIYYSDPSSSFGVEGSQDEEVEEDENNSEGREGVRVVQYSHLGDAALRQAAQSLDSGGGGGAGGGKKAHQGQRVKDREAVDGWMRASDHTGVRVVLGW